MATEVQDKSATLEPALERLLSSVRARIRSYVLVDALVIAVLLLGCAFWLSLALDWTFEPPRGLRIVLLASVAAALGYVVMHHLLGRLAMPLEDRRMALVLERRFGDFRDSLLTSVELANEPAHARDFNSEMLAHTHRDALREAGRVDVGQVFNTQPLYRRGAVALVLAITVLLMAAGARDALGVWARRNLLFSDELWPRRTHLAIEGLDENGHLKIARGSDWQLLVRADASTAHIVPEIVQVRYRTNDGARGRENMSREGVVTPGEDQAQSYTHTFKSVLSPLEFYVIGGDDREGPFYLDVVDAPTVSRMTLHCEYPPYMHRDPRDIPVAGVMEVARGTQVTIRAEANKPLVGARIDTLVAGGETRTDELALAAAGGAPRNFEFPLPRLDSDQALLFTLHDTDNIKSRDPVRLALRAVPDDPPQVNVQLRGIGTAMTPMAQLPAIGEVVDDYGVVKIWFEYRADDNPAEQKDFAVKPGGVEKLGVSEALDIREFGLEPKQKFHWTVQAADGFSLEAGSGPNVGSAQRYTIDVVTPDQLISMLEARELALRRQFEVIIEELTDTRNALAEIDLKPAAPNESEVAAQAEAAGETPLRRPVPVQVERVIQNADRSRHETLQKAIAFDDINTEMVNNRIDTEEKKVRLKDGIADPLRRVADTMFPQFDEALKRLLSQLSEPAVAATVRGEAVAQADAILAEMRVILTKMLELETFNEVLDMLREIISSQEKINNDTKSRQRQRVLDLE